MKKILFLSIIIIISTLALSTSFKNRDRNLEKFLSEDNISEREYIFGEYDCRMFVRDLKYRLEKNEFDVSIVSIRLWDNVDKKIAGHVCLFYPRENIFIEPITDNLFNLKESELYPLCGDRYIVKNFVFYEKGVYK